uniref:UBL3-like ubiquitin domain-containing protein n=1 Tax=Oryza barthii TaxID=65489 RepID=A0A0D3HRB2_9ORYZ
MSRPRLRSVPGGPSTRRRAPPPSPPPSPRSRSSSSLGGRKEITPKTVNDLKLINAGRILENNRTLVESRVRVEIPGGVITMHVVVHPPQGLSYCFLVKKKEEPETPRYHDRAKECLEIKTPSDMQIHIWSLDWTMLYFTNLCTCVVEGNKRRSGISFSTATVKEDGLTNDIPTTLHRSKADCPVPEKKIKERDSRSEKQPIAREDEDYNFVGDEVWMSLHITIRSNPVLLNLSTSPSHHLTLLKIGHNRLERLREEDALDGERS